MAWNMVTQYCNTNDFGSVAWFKFPMSKTFSKDTARYHREAAVFRQCYVHSHLWTRSKGARIKWIIEPLRRCIDFLSTCDIMWHHLTSNPIEFTETLGVKFGLVRVKADYHRSTSQPRKFHGRFTASLSIIDSQGLIDRMLFDMFNGLRMLFHISAVTFLNIP